LGITGRVEKILLLIIFAHLGCYAIALVWFKRTLGEITHFERERDSDGNVAMRGIIEYTDDEGIIRELRRWIALGPLIGGGRRVTVLYHPKYPKLALEWSLGAFLGIPVTLGMIIVFGRLLGPYFRQPESVVQEFSRI
jgi:hypothetical protein